MDIKLPIPIEQLSVLCTSVKSKFGVAIDGHVAICNRYDVCNYNLYIINDVSYAELLSRSTLFYLLQLFQPP